jgi:hypothetical protein
VLAQRIEVAGLNGVASGISAFDEVATDYANGNETLAEYWHRRLGIARHVITHIREHLGNNRDTFASEASPAMAIGLSIARKRRLI